MDAIMNAIMDGDKHRDKTPLDKRLLASWKYLSARGCRKARGGEDFFLNLTD